MSTEEGSITKVTEDKARVQVRRSSMCDACKSRSACSIIGGGDTMEAEALNTANARVGDRVLLNIPSKSLWKISFVFYMLPVIFLIAGVTIGMNLAKNYSLEPELGALLLGIMGCLLAFAIIKLFAKHVGKNKDYMPEIVKILKKRTYPPAGGPYMLRKSFMSVFIRLRVKARADPINQSPCSVTFQ
jgi:sigma-E factor negative regulatory protein RseC